MMIKSLLVEENFYAANIHKEANNVKIKIYERYSFKRYS